MRHFLCAACALLVAGPVVGQQPSPYADAGSDSVRTLTTEEVRLLLSGEGMGLARPAELNGYPGPRHVLDLADSLQLTAEQRAETGKLFIGMREEAIAAGRRVLKAERALDAGFAAGAPESELDRLARVAASRRGDLRWVHLRTHLRMREILTAQQRHAYDRLRGYGHHVTHGGPGG
jgi:Spy/CpxP family protein refolding chaperone